MKEIWKDIKGYEKLYQVSNLGNVRRIKFINNRTQKDKIKMLKLIKDKKGYLKINLWKNNKSKMFLVHRIVAETFILNPNNLPQVNHKDENKSNNCVENLEWCSQKYNNNYGNRLNNIRKKLMEKNVKEKMKNNTKLMIRDEKGKFVRRME